MSVLDARSGVVLRTVVVGVAPIAVAVDERSGRAVVVNAGGPVRIPDTWGQVLDQLLAALCSTAGDRDPHRARP